MTMPLFLIVAHTIADWPPFQNAWMALNKSKNWWALLAHVSVYTFIVTLVASYWLRDVQQLATFSVITFVTHFCTDAITSRLTTKMWYIPYVPRPVQEGYRLTMPEYPYLAAFDELKRGWFFGIIGYDQLTHLVTLALTWRYVIG